MKKLWMQLLCGAALVLGMTHANAVYTITLTEVGSDVVMSGSGQINTTGLGLTSDCCNAPAQWPGSGNFLAIGTGNIGLSNGSGITGGGVPVMGTGGSVNASSATGPSVILLGNAIYLPGGYVSNTSISNSATFNGRTLATLGATPGTYTMTLQGGDTIVVNVGNTTPVPTLGTAGQLAFALLLMTGAYFGLKRRRG